jgi:hypothetical protein
LPDEPAERLRALVIRIVHELGLNATVDIAESDEELRATVNGDELSRTASAASRSSSTRRGTAVAARRPFIARRTAQ